MKRGELWTAAGERDHAGKPRPVLILQDDRFDGTGSVTVCPLTSHELDVPLMRPPIAPSEANGLREPSFAIADKIATVPRARLRERIGALGAADMAAVSRAAIVFLGLAGQRR